MKSKKKIFLLLAFLSIQIVKAQSQTNTPAPMRCDNQTIIEKTKELVEKYKAEGYLIYQGNFFDVENNTLFPIQIRLIERTAYGVIVVGQPDLNVLEVGLGHEVFGKDEVKDVIRKQRDNGEFYTYFTYVPAFTGNYLLSIREKYRGHKHFCTAVYVLVKPNALNKSN
jgi:hypothetical protein